VVSDEYVRELDRLSKRALAGMVYEWADKHGRQWIIGGPNTWSKDELVSACVRIAQGKQP
jgi:hypothetical protein